MVVTTAGGLDGRKTPVRDAPVRQQNPAESHASSVDFPEHYGGPRRPWYTYPCSSAVSTSFPLAFPAFPAYQKNGPAAQSSWSGTDPPVESAV